MAATSAPMRESSRLKRQAILDAAFQLFLELGYEATSMNQIVAIVGGSKGTIYTWFKSKEELFKTILDEKVIEHFSPLMDISPSNTGLKEGLVLIARRTLEAISSEGGVALMRLAISEAKRSPGIGMLLYQHVQKPLHDIIEGFLDREKRVGNLACVDTHKAMEYFIGILINKPFTDGLFMLEERAPTEQQISARANEVVGDFLKMCGAI